MCTGKNSDNIVCGFTAYRFVRSEYPSALSSGDCDWSSGHVGIDDWFGHQHVDMVVEVSVNIFLQEDTKSLLTTQEKAM